MVARKEHKVQIDGRTLTLSNPDKVLYPAAGFTKGEMLRYYAAVGEVMVAHMRDRPVTLKRYPDGVDQPFFYEKQCPHYRPPWIPVGAIARESENTNVNYCLIRDRPSLLWIANLASIEIHTLLSRWPDHLRPTMMAFDLDPGSGVDLIQVAWAALQLKTLFQTIGLESFPKTSGKKGIHVYVPLNTPATFEQTKPFARAVALALERRFPDRIVSNMRKDLRRKKIFIDWSQNDDHKTTVAVYSLRATEQPSVSTPVKWEEIERFHSRGDPSRLYFAPDDVLKRLRTHGDLFEPVRELKQKLPQFSKPSLKHDAPSDESTPTREDPASPTTSPKKRALSKRRPKKAPAALKKYRSMRDFSKTPEPAGGKKFAAPEAPPMTRDGHGKAVERKRFVIQKHDATHLHYDFRLEASGVLKSWAVPKGPSTDPDDKRLAMMTEDHPLEYADFEGVIPEGEYGGGPVMVWDTGTYVNLTSDNGKVVSLQRGLAKGHIDFWLDGKKLHGAWSLIRVGDDNKKWLLRKLKDAGAHKPEDPVEKLPDSVVSGRSIDAIAKDQKSAVWHSNR